MTIKMTVIIERQSACFYIHKTERKPRNVFICKKPDTFKKLDNFCYVFIYKIHTLYVTGFLMKYFNLAFTVRLKSLTMFSGALITPHHYKSNLAHL